MRSTKKIVVIACLATNERSTNRADLRVAVWAGCAGTAFVIGHDFDHGTEACGPNPSAFCYLTPTFDLHHNREVGGRLN